MNLNIVFEDQDMVVCYKPSGMPTQTAKVGAVDMVSLLKNYLYKTQKERKEPYRRVGLGDVRLFANSLQKIVDTMVKAGYTANTKKNETDSFIEYTVRIDKQSSQMKLI